MHLAHAGTHTFTIAHAQAQRGSVATHSVNPNQNFINSVVLREFE